MQWIQADNYNAMSRIAAEIIIRKVRSADRVTLGLATGGTPLGTYEQLVADHRQNGTSYSHVTTVNLDEYVGLGGDHPNSYRFYMNQHLFRHIDIHPTRTHLPNGLADDLSKECRRYDALISDLGGIDLQVLGIGRNGHIGFNEPGTPFSSNTHVVKLTPSTRRANARYFRDFSEVPTSAITMGIATILGSKEILLLASGEDKDRAIERLLYGEIDESFPASALKNHPHVTVVADKKALSCVQLPF